jgi:hypothetical protein
MYPSSSTPKPELTPPFVCGYAEPWLPGAHLM